MADSGKKGIRIAPKIPRAPVVAQDPLTIDPILAKPESDADVEELAPEQRFDLTADTDIINVVRHVEPSQAAIHVVPTVGDRIGKYVVERVIGSGGMGLVMAARNEDNPADLVAIKLLRPKAAGDRIHAERFAREARAIARIKSDHVVKVFDAGTLESGAPYIVMEHLVGRDLGQILREDGAMPYQRAADLMLQICEAVASAHAVGVIHRDLKPSNFFATEVNGRTVMKVLDFGISKATGTDGIVDPNLTETQAVFGSPTYMSPEQIRSAKHVDHRSDIWSLGVGLYELSTGKLPFAADNVAGLLASIIADPPFFPRGFNPHLPQPFEELLLTILAKDPTQRPQSVAELAIRLGPFTSQNAGTQALFDRIGVLSNHAMPVAASLSQTTGPKLPPPVFGYATPPGTPNAPSSNPMVRDGSNPNLGHYNAATVAPLGRISQPGLAPITVPPEARISGVTFGSTGTDLANPAGVPKKSAALSIFLTFFVLTLTVGGAYVAYHFGKHQRSPAPTAATSAAPPPPPLTTSINSITPAASSAPPVVASASAEPKPAGTASGKKPPGRVVHVPGKPTPPPPPPPAPAPTPSAKPVDPTNDRF